MEKQAGQNSVLSAIRFAACSCVGKHEDRGRSQERTIKRWFGYTHFFPFVGEVIVPGGYLHEPNLWKTKTGDPNFRAAGQTFSPPITRPALEFSHSLATTWLLGWAVRRLKIFSDDLGFRKSGRKLSACLAAILLLVMLGLNCHERSQTALDRINIAVLQTLVQLHAECDNKLLLAPCGSMSLENLVR